ncbi:hypothetical protein L484_025540 [Morus notabilis]|uniref:Uncharacterized protein n=1 Tax=Morus notabilis TaxID=981085 RepID=W9RNT6_9ROSA|nr:hypothetical protein L484_025540 [Morus notabilis]
MNIGEYIHLFIRYAINNNNVGLAFPSLLIELFEKAGVDIVDNSICKPIRPLDHNGILRIWSKQPEEIEEADSSRQATKRKSKGKSMEQMFHRLTLDSGHNISGYLQLPQFPPGFHQPFQPPSFQQDDDEDEEMAPPDQ